MDTKKKTSNQNRYIKFSLKKNRLKSDVKPTKLNRSSDVIVLDESIDKMQVEVPKTYEPKNYLPIVVNDSSIYLSDDDLPMIEFPDKEPTKYSNASFNCSLNSPSPVNASRPSIGGWSPAQTIITANPKNDCVPSTPRDVANESYEHCSMRKIEKSHKKILNDLYGSAWKSIPGLFKTPSHKNGNFNGVAKKLFADDENDSLIGERKKNRLLVEINRELYLGIKQNDAPGDVDKSNSDVKKNVKDNVYGTERKSRKKLYTEKVPSTPDVPIRKNKIHANTTSKKVKIKKGMSITELVEIMSKNDKNDKAKEIDIAGKKQNISTKREDNDLQNKSKDTPRKGSHSSETENRLSNKENNLTQKVDLTNKEKNVRKKESDLTNKNNRLPRKECGLTGKASNFPSKGKYLTEKSDVKETKHLDVLTKGIDSVSLTPNSDSQRLSFMGSMADNVPTWRCHFEAFRYKDNYKDLKEQLARRLFTEFNKVIFNDSMPADLALLWDTKFRSTAGTTTNRLVRKAAGDRIRISIIKLSVKVLDTPQRLRDTLVHELCHAATWLIDAELNAGHGPLWKKWAKKALQMFPELVEISRCHDLEIHYKFTFRCTKCGYSVQRHSKSIDITKKCCGHCRGRFEIVVNKKNKDGVVVATPARQAAANGFAQFVKQNYAKNKDGTKTHAQLMKMLGEQYSAMKNKPTDSD